MPGLRIVAYHVEVGVIEPITILRTGGYEAIAMQFRDRGALERFAVDLLRLPEDRLTIAFGQDRLAFLNAIDPNRERIDHC